MVSELGPRGLGWERLRLSCSPELREVRGELAAGLALGCEAADGLGPALWPGCLAAVGQCGPSCSSAGPWAAWLLASLLDAAIFLLVLLSGDATRCHLPASLQWLSRACLPEAFLWL